jgi:hypothetical protein
MQYIVTEIRIYGFVKSSEFSFFGLFLRASTLTMRLLKNTQFPVKKNQKQQTRDQKPNL